MNKTEDAALVGKHKFEVAGLGVAPFRFIGMSENAITYPDGTTQAGGSCDYCGTGIRLECHVQGADGRRFKVGCDCIAKVGDVGILKAYKSSPEFRAHQKKLRDAKGKAAMATISDLMRQYTTALKAKPHPHGFKDRETGQPLTKFDSLTWQFEHMSWSSAPQYLKGLQKYISEMAQEVVA